MESNVYFSFIIPVYNRPQEIDELLASITQLFYKKQFEVVIIEDGSEQSSKEVIANYKESLDITYLQKKNTGPGDSRNFGMKHAKGSYFLILDSDVLLPPHYLKSVEESLKKDFVHCFGGPDKFHESFSQIQKAIDYAMTSFLTTGGIRGNKIRVQNFEPRSFNMGLSKEAFKASGGFGQIHPGEDPDLSIRLNQLGYTTKLFPASYVYHKRRIDWAKFQKQTYKFGQVRAILIKWHPNRFKITYLFPSFFMLALLIAGLFTMLDIYVFIQFFLFYFVLILLDSISKTKSLSISVLAVLATIIQFTSYGLGFMLTWFSINVLDKDEQEEFPELFFKKNAD